MLSLLLLFCIIVGLLGIPTSSTTSLWRVTDFRNQTLGGEHTKVKLVCSSIFFKLFARHLQPSVRFKLPLKYVIQICCRITDSDYIVKWDFRVNKALILPEVISDSYYQRRCCCHTVIHEVRPRCLTCGHVSLGQGSWDWLAFLVSAKHLYIFDLVGIKLFCGKVSVICVCAGTWW